MKNIQEAVAGLAKCGGTTAELSAFLRGVRKEGGEGLLRQLGGLSRDAEKLLSMDVLKAWPEGELELYVEFLSAMPYRPDPKCMPGGGNGSSRRRWATGRCPRRRASPCGGRSR